MTIKICVSILPENLNEATRFIERAESHKADFIEVRLDRLKKYNKLSDIAKCSKVPLIATNRPIQQQGKFSGSETKRKQTLLNAAKGDFEYVDLELSALGESITRKICDAGAKLIVSFHDFNKTPSLPQMNKILEQEISSGADICKIVTMAKSIEDSLTTLNFVSKAHKRTKVVCFAMGPLGKPSRLLSPLFGAFFTIASLDRERETAPGQLTVQEMKLIYQTLGLM